MEVFQSTRSSGTATLPDGRMYFNIAISIHAVLWDRDNLYMQDLRRDLYFNPRGPLGPRRGCPFAPFLHHLISIHAVLWDRDSTR